MKLAKNALLIIIAFGSILVFSGSAFSQMFGHLRDEELVNPSSEELAGLMDGIGVVLSENIKLKAVIEIAPKSNSLPARAISEKLLLEQYVLEVWHSNSNVRRLEIGFMPSEVKRRIKLHYVDATEKTKLSELPFLKYNVGRNLFAVSVFDPTNETLCYIDGDNERWIPNSIATLKLQMQQLKHAYAIIQVYRKRKNGLASYRELLGLIEKGLRVNEIDRKNVKIIESGFDEDYSRMKIWLNLPKDFHEQ